MEQDEKVSEDWNRNIVTFLENHLHVSFPGQSHVSVRLKMVVGPSDLCHLLANLF